MDVENFWKNKNIFKMLLFNRLNEDGAKWVLKHLL